MVAHERLERPHGLHRPQQVEAADAEGEAVGLGGREALGPVVGAADAGHEDRPLDAVGVHVLEQLGQLGALEERVAALEVVLLDPDHPLGLLLVAQVDVHEAVDRSGHSLALPSDSSSCCSAGLSTLPVADIGTTPASAVDEPAGRHLERAEPLPHRRRRRRRAGASVTTTRADLGPAVVAGHVGDVGLAHAGDRAQRRLDLGRVHGGALHLEHVVEAARVPEVAVVVDAAEVAGAVEAVGGEHLGRGRGRRCRAAGSGPRSQISPCSPGGQRRARLGVDDAHLDARERPAAAAVLRRRGRSTSSRSPQYGPNDSVMPNRFARAPGRRPPLRRQHRRRGCRRRATRGRRRRTRGGRRAGPPGRASRGTA